MVEVGVDQISTDVLTAVMTLLAKLRAEDKPMAIVRRTKDPLGYDTHSSDCLNQMARDALTGRYEVAVNEELAAVRKAFGTPSKTLPRWYRLKRWISHRFLRLRYWREDLGW